MKCSSKIFQNLLHFMHEKTITTVCFFIMCNFIFLPYECLFYVNIDQGIPKVKMQSCLVKKEIKFLGFLDSYYIKYSNFSKCFARTFCRSANLLFLKSACISIASIEFGVLGGKTLFLCSIPFAQLKLAPAPLLCMCLICIVRSAAVRKVVNAFS